MKYTKSPRVGGESAEFELQTFTRRIMQRSYCKHFFSTSQHIISIISMAGLRRMDSLNFQVTIDTTGRNREKLLCLRQAQSSWVSWTMPNSLVWWKWLTKRVWECLPCKIKTSIQNLSRQIKKRVVFCNICLVLAPDFLPHSSGLSPKRTRHPSFADPFLAGNVASVLDVGISMKKNHCTCHQGILLLPFQSSSFLGK